MKKFSFEINGFKYEVNVKKVEGDTAKLEVNGTPYSVKLHQEIKASKTPILVRSAVTNDDAKQVAGEKLTPVAETKRPSSNTIKSPLPGNVTKVLVKEGDTFQEGDTLLVLESRKIENNSLAETSGTVVKVNAPVGTSVLQDDVLFEIA